MEGNIVYRVRKSVLNLSAKTSTKLITYFWSWLYHASAQFTYRFFARNVAEFRIYSAIKPNLMRFEHKSEY